MTLIVVFTALSCERDTFWIETGVGRVGTGKPVEVLINFEVPKSEVEAVTRSLTEEQEHIVNDIYILVFEKNDDTEDKKLFGKYYAIDEINRTTFSEIKGDWVSVEQKIVEDEGGTYTGKYKGSGVNSTNGTIKVSAIDGECYIYALANVGADLTGSDVSLAAVAVNEPHKAATKSLRKKLDEIEKREDLLNLQVHLMSDLLGGDVLQRDVPNLLFSGGWSRWQNKEGESYHDEGYVNIAASGSPVGESGDIDLTDSGMIYLRALISQISFKIDWNTDIIEDFKPESWQVIHVPTRSWLMDHGDAAASKLYDEIAFTSSQVNTTMMQTEGSFQFQFYMYENHKDARNISNDNSEKSFWYGLNSLKSSYSTWLHGDNNLYINDDAEATSIANYYINNFGSSLTQTLKDGKALPKLHTVYGYLDEPDESKYTPGARNADYLAYGAAVEAMKPENVYTKKTDGINYDLTDVEALEVLNNYLGQLGISIPTNTDIYKKEGDSSYPNYYRPYMYNTAVRAYCMYVGSRPPRQGDNTGMGYEELMNPDYDYETDPNHGPKFSTGYGGDVQAQKAMVVDLQAYNKGRLAFYPLESDYTTDAYNTALAAYTAAITPDGTGKTPNEKAATQFIYAKRELELKRNTNNKVLMNQAGDYNFMPYYGGDQLTQSSPSTVNAEASGWEYEADGGKWLKNQYDSKKFVYVEPKATYVVIKGRLRFKHQVRYVDSEGNYVTENDGNATGVEKGIFITNYAAGYDRRNDLLKSQEILFHDGYADVTYTIHLGYVDNDPEDFTVKRNTKYVYHVTINNVNSIYTNVEGYADTKLNPIGPDYHVKRQPGADGYLNLAKGNVYNTDAHYNQFNFMLTKAGLENFYFEIHTPWSDITADGLNEDIETLLLDPRYTLDSDTYKNSDLYKTKYANNPDFNWFLFRPAWDQTGMMEEIADETSLETRLEQLKKTRPTVKYRGDPHEDDCPIWNLFDFMWVMKKLVNDAMSGNLYEEKFACSVNGVEFNGDTKLPFLLDAAYVERLKGVDPPQPMTSDQKAVLGPINRMFYTVYVNEYYYEQAPNGQNWDDGLPYWTKFVNQPSRYINFGYRGVDASSTYKGYIPSPDGQSGVMTTQFTVVQSSIQTFYNTEVSVGDVTSILGSNPYVALGLEHSNETYDARWTDRYTTIPSTGLDVKNGWLNAKKWIVDTNTRWSTYVSDKVYDEKSALIQPNDPDGLNGIMNNVTMIRSDNLISDVTRMKSGNETSFAASDNPYLAGAIRMCMNRNRDENGDGKIDEYELKWYLPTSAQLSLSSMCHYSLYDPLFNYNDHYIEQYKDAQRLLPSSGGDIHGKYFFTYHFLGSDYSTLTSEEMMNTPRYNNSGAWASRPHDMRCVRNLGGTKQTHTVNVYDSSGNPTGSTITYIQDYPGASPVDVYVYDREDKEFSFRFLDSRSIRKTYYPQELPMPHYQYSKTNLPYRQFKVAKNLVLIQREKAYFILDDKVDAGDDYQHVFGMNKCHDYSEELDEVDKGSWRIPNMAELAIMEMCLRDARNTNGKLDDFGVNAWFFNTVNNNTAQLFSCTSWNYTGPWGRLLGIRYDAIDGWDIYSSDPSTWASLTKEQSYGSSHRTDVDIMFRCVKDLHNVSSIYKTYDGSTSEGFN